MNICIPIEVDKGLESEICLRFGTASQFIIVDTNTMKYNIVQGDDSDQTVPEAIMASEKIDSVVVGGIGVRSLCDFKEAGIDVVSTREDRVEEIVASFNKGEVNPVTLDHTCAFRHVGRGFRGPGGCGGEGCF